ncbi:MAG: DUF3109 family protein [Bacteroidaceae bacterium]|nr:DUF3109 family protein [Bacteroidaceae bacterium]
MNIVMVGNVVLSVDCLREMFCCDMQACRGICCVEGDSGAPITEAEATAIEGITDSILDDLSPQAQEIIMEQGISYVDREGDLVTSIVGGKDCVFTCYDEQGNCLCAIQKAQQEGRISVGKPISCSLYPIREKQFRGGLVGLNFHRWDVCRPACRQGKRLGIPVYKFLRKPLIQRFGEEWYEELEQTAQQLKEEGYL